MYNSEKTRTNKWVILLFLTQLCQLVTSNQYQSGTLSHVLYVATSPHVLADTHVENTAISITNTFPTAFTEDPQILFSFYSLHFETQTSGGYVFSVVSQSTTGNNIQQVLGFTVSVSAPTTQKIYNVLIKWLAFIDKGKQIMSQDFYTPDATETFSETHYNQNFVMAVPILNYFVYSAQFSFKFDIVAVDSTQLSVSLTASGITQLGFQVLIAVASPIFLQGPQQWTPSSQLYNNPFIVSSSAIPTLQQSDYVNFPLFNGLTSDVVNEFNIQELSFSASSTLSFQIGSCIKSLNLAVTCSISDSWLGEMLISPRFQIPPLLLETFTQTEYYDSGASQPITVEIPQLRTTYTASTTDWIQLDNTYIGLQVIVTTECLFTYQHNYWFLGSVEDNKQYIADFFYCSDNFNRMKYIINFNDGSRLEYKKIKLTFTPTSVQIDQMLDNIQFGETYRMLKIVISQAR